MAHNLELRRKRVEPLHRMLTALVEAIEGMGSSLTERASVAAQDSSDLRSTLDKAREEAEEAKQTVVRIRDDLTQLEIERGRLEVRVEHAATHLAEVTDNQDEAFELPAPEDRAQAEAELEETTQAIAKLGPINQVAGEHYDELHQRAEKIDKALADIRSAQKAVNQVISAIDRKMRQAFLDAFGAVNKNFGEIFAMLFPGGRGELILTDPNDPSETGLDIAAQPRGKRLPKLALLSGGEKSLTALALLFALYKTRTVPFYIFDEVEAALDDANLHKLLDAIDVLKQDTQLIVISHQRATMEKADVLWGVSMGPSGVSQVVSQRLEGGNLKDLPAEEPA